MEATLNSTPAAKGRELAPPALRLERVSKRYTKRGFSWLRPERVETQALHEVSFSARQGETLGLLGPNGAGKTTLLKIISTLIYPSSGSVTVFGHDAAREPVHVRRVMGLVTCDERSFYWKLTGRQNLRFFATLYGIPHRQAAARIEVLLDALDLTYAADRIYQGYSSGMKQKMAIARGLLGEPKLVLYDEPTRSLDPLSAQNIRAWIAREREKSPNQIRILATNQLNEAEQLCDRVIIINHGKLVAQGTIQEIRERWHQEKWTEHIVTCRGLPAGFTLQTDVDRGLLFAELEPGAEGASDLRIRAVRDSEALSLALRAILASGATVTRCHAEQIPFDEVFCSMIAQAQEARS